MTTKITVTRISLPNFDGQHTKFPAPGKYSFNANLDRTMADQLSRKGWNIAYYAPEADDDVKSGVYVFGRTNIDDLPGDVYFSLKCKIQYRKANGEPLNVRIYQTIDDDNRPMLLNEETIKGLQHTRFKTIDLSIAKDSRGNAYVNEAVFNISTKPLAYKSAFSDKYDMSEFNEDED